MWSFPRRAPWALRLAQIQLSVIYISTVWEKAAGAGWRDGTAVSYAVRIGEVSRLPVPSFVTDSPLLTELATYGTLAAELAIGVLVWNRAARPWVLALGVLLHLSIELTLAVGFFSLTIVTLYLAFLPPERAEQVLLVGARPARDGWSRRPSAQDPRPESRRSRRNPSRRNGQRRRPGSLRRPSGSLLSSPPPRPMPTGSSSGDQRDRALSRGAVRRTELTLSSRCDGCSNNERVIADTDMSTGRRSAHGMRRPGTERA